MLVNLGHGTEIPLWRPAVSTLDRLETTGEVWGWTVAGTHLGEGFCGGQQDVLRLQVTVDHVLEVQVSQGHQDLGADGGTTLHLQTLTPGGLGSGSLYLSTVFRCHCT